MRQWMLICAWPKLVVEHAAQHPRPGRRLRFLLAQPLLTPKQAVAVAREGEGDRREGGGRETKDKDDEGEAKGEDVWRSKFRSL